MGFVGLIGILASSLGWWLLTGVLAITDKSRRTDKMMLSLVVVFIMYIVFTVGTLVGVVMSFFGLYITTILEFSIWMAISSLIAKEAIGLILRFVPDEE